MRDQYAGKAIGASIELGVRQRRVAEAHGHSIRPCRGRGVEQVDQRHVARDVRPGHVPGGHDGLVFGGVHDVDVADRNRRVGGDCVQNSQEALREAVDQIGVEQIGCVLEHRIDTRSSSVDLMLGEPQLEVEFRYRDVEFGGHGAEPTDGEFTRHGRFQRQRHLEQRVP
ncbi:hypothetical protein HQO39_19980 [Rhodococcus fascians]|nr:hypothetical protein [Rhodococcus fascians]